MKKSRRAAKESGVSLLPFLDVLLCTMGALIVVLIVVSRHVQITKSAVKPPADEQLDSQAQLELIELRVSLLREQRAKTLDDLSNQRLKLGHIEDHTRELESQLAELERAAQELEKIGSADLGQLNARQAELAHMIDEIHRREAALAEDAKEAQSKEPSYAIVPYKGPHGTRRRPIYIECCEDAIILQPEGVRFTESDFAGSAGPGNPLAAAVRAVREYRVSSDHRESADGNGSYPLLIVRPNGIVAYYVARSSLKSWDTEFGYELVDQDWNLTYPAPDPRLAKLMLQAADAARDRQVLMVKRAPRHFENSEPVSFRASPSGRGVIPDQTGTTRAGGRGRSRGPGGWGGGSGSYASQHGGSSVPGAGGTAIAQSDGNAPEGGFQYTGHRGHGGVEGSENGGGYGAGGSPDGESGGTGSGDGSPLPYAAALASARGGTGDGQRSGTGPAGGIEQGGAGEGGSGQGSGTPGESDSGDVASETDGTGAAPGGSGGTVAMGGAAPPGQSPVTVGSPSITVGPSGDAIAPQTTTSGQGPAQGRGNAHVNMINRSGRADRSLAESRGKDWGLPDALPSSTAVTRPISIRCYADRLIVMPRSGQTQDAKIIPFSEGTIEGVDALVSHVWDETKSWGIAGENMYWKPTLSFDVDPLGEARFKQVESLLAGSGLEVQRRQAKVEPVARRTRRWWFW